MVKTATRLFETEGIKGLYRGGLPIFIGGALFRSAQFGVYESTLRLLRSQEENDASVEEKYELSLKRRVLGQDYKVFIAGFCGGKDVGGVLSTSVIVIHVEMCAC